MSHGEPQDATPPEVPENNIDPQVRTALLARLRGLFAEPDFRITQSSGSYFCVCYPRRMEHGEITIDLSSNSMDCFVAWGHQIYDFWNFEPDEPDVIEAIVRKARAALIKGEPATTLRADIEVPNLPPARK
jgi:hypothetical protein